MPFTRWLGPLGWSVALMATANLSALSFAAGPVPPCAGESYPAASPAGKPLTIVSWYEDDARGLWQPAACMDWRSSTYTVLIAASGEFEFRGRVAEMTERIGQISALNHVQYWSVSKQQWRPLITNAAALVSDVWDDIRADFSASELVQGRRYFFRQTEKTPAGDMVYEAVVLEQSERKIRLRLHNAYPVTRWLTEWIKVGEYQSYYEFTRLDDERWHYYTVLRSNAASWLPSKRYDSSYKNRAVAMFRHFAGIPTDSEPPQFLD